jgi:Methyl-accepting chemotaxis protein-like, first PDC sensor domain
MADLEAAGSRVRAALEDMFGAVAEIGAAFAAQRRGCRAPGAELTPDRLEGMREVIWRQLGLLPGADGAGVVAAPGVVAGKQRHLEWWQRTLAADGGQGGFARIRLNLDPESVDLYDYLDMDWFTVPRELGRRYVYGPYVDFSGADRYVLTLTVPVVADGEFLGIAGTDIRMSHLEPELLAMLRPVPVPAVLVTGERRVVAANTPRWIPGTRLGQLPAPGDGTFAAVAEIGADSGWLLAAAAP